MSAPTKQEMLDAVNTAILNIASGGAVQSYMVAGRQISKYSLRDLESLRDKLQAEINSANGGATNYVEFCTPS